MNKLASEIAALSLSLASSQRGGKVQQHRAVADILLKIVRKAAQAYLQHTGEPPNPGPIKGQKPV